MLRTAPSHSRRPGFRLPPPPGRNRFRARLLGQLDSRSRCQQHASPVRASGTHADDFATGRRHPVLHFLQWLNRNLDLCAESRRDAIPPGGRTQKQRSQVGRLGPAGQYARLRIAELHRDGPLVALPRPFPPDHRASDCPQPVHRVKERWCSSARPRRRRWFRPMRLPHPPRPSVGPPLPPRPLKSPSPPAPASR